MEPAAEIAATPPEAAESEQASAPTSALPALPKALFGYDRDATRQALTELQERHDTLLRERAERDERIKELELELHRRQESERLIGETLVSAQREAQSIRDTAQRQADELLEAAKGQAQTIREDAELDGRAKATEFLRAAERERDAVLGEAERAKAFIQETREHLSDFLLSSVKLYEHAQEPEEPEPNVTPLQPAQPHVVDDDS